ncbi:MAG: aspartate aminotransferase family protein, partial [Nannocystaceae bacterium]
MTIESRYAAEFRSHQRLAEAARKRLPDGVTSDSRCLAPFPLFIASAKGARKWDHDGREFIDLWSGHGALLFGHGAPELLEALREQGSCGTHFGACHPLATEWAEQIAAQMPAAKRVRFTNSGTEAVLLALHLARAFTGRPKILRFAGHYHGWYADARSSEQAADPHDPVLQRAQEVVLTCPNHLDAAAAALREHRDIGAIILEPTGPCSGVVPLDAAFVQGLYALSRAHNCVLIFDEIVTGFRVAAGGAQTHYGVQPDLTTLAKIVCGGLPGGAVCGRAEILDQLSKMHLQSNWSAV